MTPTFPYPLTTDVRADLWRFFGDDALADTEPGNWPGLPDTAITPSGKAPALLDTPFARAFVAWREAGMVDAEERSCLTCAHGSPTNCPDFMGETYEYDPATAYVIESGANENGGVPTDRTIKCPVWKAKP